MSIGIYKWGWGDGGEGVAFWGWIDTTQAQATPLGPIGDRLGIRFITPTREVR